jgi:hypothetical protein
MRKFLAIVILFSASLYAFEFDLELEVPKTDNDKAQEAQDRSKDEGATSYTVELLGPKGHEIPDSQLPT